MEGISGITARMAGIQAQIDALAVGGPGRAAAPVAASAPTSGAASSSAFSDALAQQLGQQPGLPQPGGAASSLAAALGGGTGAGGLATALAGGATASAEAAFTTTTTSLSSDGLAQLLAALPGARGGAPAGAGTTAGAPAVGAVGAAGAASSTPSAVGRLDAKGVPLDLRAHGNGKVPEGQLVEIGGPGSGERLWGPAAAAYDRMAAAARADGVSWRVNDSYRSYEDQVSMAARKGLRSEGGLAAAPGTSSHGWGMAVDLGLDGRAQAWMRENAGRYGFAETVSGEPWHWGFRPTSAA